MINQRKYFSASAKKRWMVVNVLKLPGNCRGLESCLPCPAAKERRCACHNTIVRRKGLYNQCNGTNFHQNSESFYNNEHTLITKPGVQRTILSWLSRGMLVQGVPLRSLLPRRIRARWSACRVTPTPTEAQDKAPQAGHVDPDTTLSMAVAWEPSTLACRAQVGHNQRKQTSTRITERCFQQLS